jgi:3-deoxy-D-manno-octulosonate 8-phosphate phosphatase (KDO 8-P phosphatase)
MGAMPKVRKKLKGAELKKALAKVKVLILDVDGVMTDGRIFWTEEAGWGAMYSVIDGFGIRCLMKAGVEVCVISGGAFVSHKKRAEVLGIRHAYFGDENKLTAFAKIKADLGVADSDCAYMGDELFDIPVLEKVAFAAAPPHAPEAVKRAVSYITRRQGGFGCVRELTDLILEARPGGG